MVDALKCCSEMRHFARNDLELAARAAIAVVPLPFYGKHALVCVPFGDEIVLIRYCPWCGRALPSVAPLRPHG